jgi:hypothetical protein
MTNDKQHIVEACLRDSEIVGTILRHDRAERAFGRALATLWIGNVGAALATMLYATANRHDGTFTRSLLAPLVLFVIGLSVTGIASLIEFETERRILDGGPDDKRAAADKPRFPSVWRTAAAVVSAACSNARMRKSRPASIASTRARGPPPCGATARPTTRPKR